MKILALEFSPPERSIAIVIDGQVRGFTAERTPHASRPFELIEGLLNEAGLNVASVECIAVGLGPGSYAGTRTAISMAQGWQLAQSIKLLGLNSAEAVARRAQRATIHGMVNVVFDAQRNEAYAARYKIDSALVQPLGPFQLLTADEEARRRTAGETFLKGDAGPWRLGEQAQLFSDARVIGEMAAERNNFLPGSQLEPIYLRKAEFIKAAPAKFPTLGE